MMGRIREQGQLFYRFDWRIMFRRITFCAKSTGFSISLPCVLNLRRSTAKPGGRLSILN